MKERPQISESEWKVMKVVWKKNPITANGVIELLSGSVAWKPKTIQTLLVRLMNKGILLREKEQGVFHFSPALQEADCARLESQSFLSKVFDGKVAPFLSCLVEAEELSAKEIKELKSILDGKK